MSTSATNLCVQATAENGPNDKIINMDVFQNSLLMRHLFFLCFKADASQGDWWWAGFTRLLLSTTVTPLRHTHTHTAPPTGPAAETNSRAAHECLQKNVWLWLHNTSQPWGFVVFFHAALSHCPAHLMMSLLVTCWWHNNSFFALHD